jgi:hypothetical protein
MKRSEADCQSTVHADRSLKGLNRRILISQMATSRAVRTAPNLVTQPIAEARTTAPSLHNAPKLYARHNTAELASHRISTEATNPLISGICILRLASLDSSDCMIPSIESLKEDIKLVSIRHRGRIVAYSEVVIESARRSPLILVFSIPTMFGSRVPGAGCPRSRL